MSKLPTAEDYVNTLPHNLEEDTGKMTVTDYKDDLIKAIESHTAAHTAGLREKLRIETQKAKAFGNALDIATKDELALRERVKELEACLEKVKSNTHDRWYILDLCLKALSK